MGQAFHRKQIPVGRGARTPGTGIRYMNTIVPPPRELTAEQIAAREAESQQRTTLGEQRRLRQKHVADIVNICEQVLNLWKEATDYNDRRMIEFPGWTAGNFCILPLDDDDIARALLDEFQYHGRRLGRSLSLDEMDTVVDQHFRNERAVPTKQVVEAAIKIIRRTVEEYCDHDGILLEPFVKTLAKRAVRTKQQNIGLDSALSFVSKRLTPAVTEVG